MKVPACWPLVVVARTPVRRLTGSAHPRNSSHFLIISHNHHISATTNGIRNNRPTRRPPARRAGHRVPQARPSTPATAPRSARHSQPSGNTGSPPDGTAWRTTSLASTTSEAMIMPITSAGELEPANARVRATTAGLCRRAHRSRRCPRQSKSCGRDARTPRHTAASRAETQSDPLHDWSCHRPYPERPPSLSAPFPTLIQCAVDIGRARPAFATPFSARSIRSPNFDPDHLGGVWVEW